MSTSNCPRVTIANPTLCNEGGGGLGSSALIINFDSIYTELTGQTTGFSLNVAQTEITGISGVTETGYDSGFAYKHALKYGKSNYKIENVGFANGNHQYKTTITLYFPAVNSEKIQLLDQANAGKTIILIQDRNDQWLLFGKKYGLDLDTSNLDSGTVADDPNGLTLTFVGYESYPAYVVDTTAVNITSLIVTT